MNNCQNYNKRCSAFCGAEYSRSWNFPLQVLTTSLVGNTLVLWTVLAHRRFGLVFCAIFPGNFSFKTLFCSGWCSLLNLIVSLSQSDINEYKKNRNSIVGKSDLPPGTSFWGVFFRVFQSIFLSFVYFSKFYRFSVNFSEF